MFVSNDIFAQSFASLYEQNRLTENLLHNLVNKYHLHTRITDILNLTKQYILSNNVHTQCICTITDKSFEKHFSISICEQLTGQSIDSVKYIIDPSIKAGCRIKVGEFYWDASLQNLSQQLRTHILHNSFIN